MTQTNLGTGLRCGSSCNKEYQHSSPLQVSILDTCHNNQVRCHKLTPMKDTYAWIVTFVVPNDIAKEFQQFMEDIHFKTIEQTDCFKKHHDKFVTKGETHTTIVYIHYPLSPTAWARYNNEHRERVKQEFIDKYGVLLAEKIITMSQVVDYGVRI